MATASTTALATAAPTMTYKLTPMSSKKQTNDHQIKYAFVFMFIYNNCMSSIYFFLNMMTFDFKRYFFNFS